MATTELRLTVQPDHARGLVGEELARQGFTVASTPSGGLDVSRGSLGTTVVAGAFAGQDMHVRIDVDFQAVENGTLVRLSNSAATGFIKGGVIGASRAGDAVREAANRLGQALAARGVVEGVPAGSVPSPAEPSGPPPAAAIPPPIDYAGRTNVVAIVAIVLGFLFPVGGIVAGAVALAQVKRTGEKGRGLALAGIIVGSVMIVLFIALLAGIVAFGVLAERNQQAGLSGPDSSEIAPDGGESTTDGESVDVFSLRIGDCLNEGSGAEVSEVEVVDCAQLHDYEVYSEFTISGDAFPGVDAVDGQAVEGCAAAFPGFVGLSYEESTLDYSYFAPTEQSWNTADDRLVSCLIYDTVAQNSGSLAGAAR